MNRTVILPRLPVRPAEGHKGMFGRVLVVGGSDSMIGAPVLAGTASLKVGAGLVQIAVPRSILAAAISITPELIGLPLGGGSMTAMLEAAAGADALVIGPGMGTGADAKSRLMRLMKLDRAAVLDADALNLLAAQKRWPSQFKLNAVLTPHPGEMKRLTSLLPGTKSAILGRVGRATDPGQKVRLGGGMTVPNDDAGRIEIAALAARTFRQVVVLKGHRTIVMDGQKVYVNRTGDSSLSKAGTGDVLSGIIGTLLAQEMDRFDAACAGVWLHGRAGEIAGRRLGRRSVLARDVIAALPEAIRAYESEAG